MALALCSTALVFAHPFSWLLGSLLALVGLRSWRSCWIAAVSLAPSAAIFLQTMNAA